VTGEEGRIYPLQEAFVEEDAPQCGFCIPGMIFFVKALLDRKPRPTEEDLKNAIDGNLCRCGSYSNVIKVALKVSE
jgi:aerobic-type carbon monoxide dehydrogenase small subunit (CoxS/CutS family)